jgi:hypothetical protein
MKKLLISLTLILVLTGSLLCTDIFINGTKVTGIKDQEIKNCNVKIDSEGNIHIEAPEIKIVTQSEKPSNEYFISISVNSPLPADFTVSLNGKVIGKLDSGQKDALVELGKEIKKGENIISFITQPVKEPVKFTILVGTGVKKGEHLEFTPVSTQEGVVNHLGAAGNFKINAE